MHGVTTVKELRDCDRGTIKLSGIDRLADMAKEVLRGCFPLKIIDYQMENPYQLKCGDNWESIIRTTTVLSPFVSINHIVLQMAEAAMDIMSGTIFFNNWLFYHDALLLMTFKE